MTFITRTALAAALACAAPGAFAQATAAGIVYFDNFSYTLVDLDPTDEITPQLTWTQFVSQSSGRTSAQVPGTTPWPSYSVTGTDKQTDMAGSETTINLGGAYAGTAQDTGTAHILAAGSGEQQVSKAVTGGYFTLTGNTAVTFTVNAYIQGQGTVADGTPPLQGTDWRYFQISGDVSLGSFVGGSATEPGTVIAFDEQHLPDLNASLQRTIYPLNGGANEVDATKQLVVGFKNLTAAGASYSVGVAATASGYTVAPAIPEPGTWLLTGLGLGAAAWAGRRRVARTAA